jgi:CheY-like chemotaxis protein
MSDDLGGRRILVVEDEAILAWALQDMLTGYGYEVVGPAARVSQALDLIGREAVDAAVLDVNLNGQKCYPIADALVARGVPFLFSTAYSSEGIEKDYRHHTKLQKPFSAPDLAKALAALLAERPLGN